MGQRKLSILSNPFGSSHELTLWIFIKRATMDIGEDVIWAELANVSY